MKVKTEGIDELANLADKLSISVSSAAKKTEGEYKLEELLNPEFMTKYTKYPDMDKFIDASGIENVEDKLDTPEFNAFVSANTEFEDFDDMCATAAQEYMMDRIDEELDW